MNSSVTTTHEPITTTHESVRRLLVMGAWALPAYGLLLVLGTLNHQPDPTTDFAGYADYVTTGHFLVSHLVASIFGAGIGVIGLTATAVLVASSSGRPARALLGGALSAVGNVVTAAVFGAAAFAQPAIGRAQQAGFDEIVAVDKDVYGAPLIGTAVVGLLLLMAGAIMVGRAVSQVDQRLRAGGIVLAVALPVFVVTGFLLPVLQPVAAAVATGAAFLVARRIGPATEPR